MATYSRAASHFEDAFIEASLESELRDSPEGGRLQYLACYNIMAVAYRRCGDVSEARRWRRRLDWSVALNGSVSCALVEMQLYWWDLVLDDATPDEAGIRVLRRMAAQVVDELGEWHPDARYALATLAAARFETSLARGRVDECATIAETLEGIAHAEHCLGRSPALAKWLAVLSLSSNAELATSTHDWSLLAAVAERLGALWRGWREEGTSSEEDLAVLHINLATMRLELARRGRSGQAVAEAVMSLRRVVDENAPHFAPADARRVIAEASSVLSLVDGLWESRESYRDELDDRLDTTVRLAEPVLGREHPCLLILRKYLDVIHASGESREEGDGGRGGGTSTRQHAVTKNGYFSRGEYVSWGTAAQTILSYAPASSPTASSPTVDKPQAVHVSRSVAAPVTHVWEVLVSPIGSQALLGEGAVLGAKGEPYHCADGTSGILRSYHPLEQLRVSWHETPDSPPSIVEIDLMADGNRTVLELRHDRIPDHVEVARLRLRWSDGLERLARVVAE